MTPVEEFREIIGGLKNLLVANQDMGFDFPSLCRAADVGLQKNVVQSGLLEELQCVIGDCRRCRLWKGRNRLVFGEGSSEANLVFVGEGPGQEEDLSGRPFVGEAGRLLTKIIENGMGLKRDEVYICNVVKCRPPENRDPERDEIEACVPFLRKQLKIIRPSVICVLGRIAGRELLGRDFRITRDRGKWYTYMDIPVMATYHPAYILRNPSRERELKGQVWKDIQKIMGRLGLEIRKNV
jgi:uracil-DNA glycosylase family 4